MLDPAEAIWDIVTLQLKGSKYFQLQAMSLAVCDGLGARDAALLPTPLGRQDLLLASQDVESLWRQARAAPKPPGDLTPPPRPYSHGTTGESSKVWRKEARPTGCWED